MWQSHDSSAGSSGTSNNSGNSSCMRDGDDSTPTGSHRRCAPQSPPNARRPMLLHFPPPPQYPPPCAGRFSAGGGQPSSQQPRQCAGEALAINMSSSSPEHVSHVVRFDPNDYSYVYYEPGPATRHVNVPVAGPSHMVSHHMPPRANRHTYVTRYGTQENIYEEISDMARCARQHDIRMRTPLQQSLISLNQSLVEEEVRRVQSRHRRILGELNLSVEAMLMPSPSSNEGSDEAERDGERDDQLADLLSVGPTDELLSPANCNPLLDMDSGFSGSSSGASYQSAVGSLRRGPARPRSALSSYPRSSTPVASPQSDGPSTSSRRPPECTSTTGTGSKSFWSKKGWRKLTGFASSNNINKTVAAAISKILSRNEKHFKSTKVTASARESNPSSSFC